MNVDIVSENTIIIELRHLLHEGVQQAQHQNQSVLVSLSERIWPLDPIALFQRGRQCTADQFFLAQPGEAFALVGLGIAQAIDAVEESRFRQIGTSWQHTLAGAIVEGPRGLPGVGLTLLGGFAFDTQPSRTEIWQGFPAARMVLPSLQFTFSGDEAWLTCNVLVTPQSNPDIEANTLARLYEDLLAPEPPHKNGIVPHTTLHELRSAQEWQAEVADVARAIRHGDLEKAVMARAVRLDSSHDFDLASALRKLVRDYVGCHIFAIGHRDQCFLGATPERLLRLRDHEIKTMSLAGSIRRGTTDEEDQQMGEALLNSQKDRGEHTVVTRMLVEALRETCDWVEASPEPSLLKLGNVQHLRTQITARLSADHTLLEVVERLHPTPAVGGWPREAALNLIREKEGLDRGWYAGPIGWLNAHGDGEFFVAIRSALVRGREAYLFAGCGIVADSDPEREYAESCLKLKPMLSALSGS
jgi:isochorismate synthase